MHGGRRIFWDVLDRGEELYLRLEGVIDEDNPLQELLVECTGKRVAIDASKVIRINSCGVRDWVRWLAALEARSNQVFLVQCPPSLVAQLNMVRNFSGERGQVLSILAPFYCESCDREHLEKLSPQQLVANQLAAPERFCERCGEAMLFDDLPESFFGFAREHGAREVPPEVVALADAFEAVRLAR